MGDNLHEVNTAQKSEGALTWAAHNILDPAINAGPLGIYNTVADLTHLPECKLTVDEATPYSKEWFAQGLSGGVGAALPFMLAAAGTSKAFELSNAALAGTKVGEIAAPLLTSSRAAAIIGASAYGALQKPDENHTRLGNAVGMGLGFLAFDRGNALAADLPLWGKVVAYPATGFAGGLVMSEGSQLASNGKFASADQALQSAVQGMTLNSVMPLAQEGMRRYSEHRAAVAAAKEDAATSKDTGYKIVIQRDGDSKGGTLDQLAVGREGDQSLVANEIKLRENASSLSQLSQSYSDWLKDNQVKYPDPEEFSKLTPNEIVNRGFYHPDATNLDQLKLDEQFGHDGPRPLPNADVVASEVAKSMAGMPMAKPTGDLTLGEWNGEFLNADKANYFQKTYSEVVPRHHIMTIEEADEGGLARIAKDNGYNYAVSAENTRGQAVGFLVNPRLKILGTHSYDDVANVHGIPDLRPAFRVDLQDTATGDKFSAIALHLKSMRGGAEQTAPVRTQQAALLAKALEPNFKGYIAGDMNTLLDQTNDLAPLYNSGFKLLNPNDHSTTQSMGGRLDGFLTKNMPGTLSGPTVRPFFQNPLITRGLSDHGLLSTTWHQDNVGAAASTAAGLAVRSGFIPSYLQSQRGN